MQRDDRRTVCRTCKRTLPRAAARCPWCAYGIGFGCGASSVENWTPIAGYGKGRARPVIQIPE